MCKIVAGILICCCLFTVDVQLRADLFEPGVQVGTVASLAVNEASGIAASALNSDVLWVHNDSNTLHLAQVFAMDTQGTHLGTYTLPTVLSNDWEDMAVGPGPIGGQSYLYLGDIGDNSAERSSIQVYRVAEPAVSSTQTPVTVDLVGFETIELEYPDTAHDAETLFVDPLTSDIYVITKRDSKSLVYRAAYPQSTIGTNTMQYVAQLPWNWATGGDISPDGNEIIVRGYWSAWLWSRPSGGDLWDAFDQPGVSVPLVGEPQGEAIGFDAAGNGYYTTSENASAGPHQPIYYFERSNLPNYSPGDANQDGQVNAADAIILAANWQAIGADWSQGDFNNDGTVNDIDATLLATNWQTPATSATQAPETTVPEPGWLVLLLSALCMTAARGIGRRICDYR